MKNAVLSVPSDDPQSPLGVPLSGTGAAAVVPGDMDGSGTVDLVDGVLVLQVLGGMQPGVTSPVGVNGDTKIGPAEGINVLQLVGGLRFDFFGAPCTANGDCSSGEYCSKPPGECDAQGVCSPTPGACPDILEPVCGCDGSTYPNACVAVQAGVNVSYQGECQ